MWLSEKAETVDNVEQIILGDLRMREKFKFLKFYFLPLILSFSLLAFCGYMAWVEYKINNFLIEQSLKGNPIAIEILIKYEKPSKLDRRLIYEALNQNEHAIKVLQIDKI